MTDFLLWCITGDILTNVSVFVFLVQTHGSQGLPNWFSYQNSSGNKIFFYALQKEISHTGLEQHVGK